MKKINSFVLFVFIWLTGNVSAQELPDNNVRFSGVVMNSETTNPIPQVNCRLDSILTTTDQLGRFVLNTQAGDTILFTYVGMQPYQVVVPDTLRGGEYILAVFMSSDTLLLPEVVVVHRYAQQSRQYRINARNNMAGVRQDAFSPNLQMTQRQNQQRVLDEFAASTNKGHVDVKLSVGAESYRVLRNMMKAKNVRNEPPELLNREEIDLVKMLFSIDRKK